MREAPNFDDANLVLRLYDLRREPEMRKARATVGSLSGRPWTEVEPVLSHDHPENAHLRQATSYWEMVAAFVNRGILHPDMYLDACGEGLFTFWTFRPHLAAIRATGRERFLLQTERLVSDHEGARERLAAIDRQMERVAASDAAVHKTKTTTKTSSRGRAARPAKSAGRGRRSPPSRPR